jgi:hypothetical protein
MSHIVCSLAGELQQGYWHDGFQVYAPSRNVLLRARVGAQRAIASRLVRATGSHKHVPSRNVFHAEAQRGAEAQRTARSGPRSLHRVSSVATHTLRRGFGGWHSGNTVRGHSVTFRRAKGRKAERVWRAGR